MRPVAGIERRAKSKMKGEEIKAFKAFHGQPEDGENGNLSCENEKGCFFTINSSACNGSCLIFSYFNEKLSACMAHGLLQPAMALFVSYFK